MLDFQAVRAEHTQAINQLSFEIETIWRQLQSNDWYGETSHFPFMHYGYMMATFARLDLLSRYWAGDTPQTKRMVAFLDQYVHPGKTEENCVAVHLWRHTLMHTGEARRIVDKTTNKQYTWRLDFGPGTQMPPHYTIYYSASDRLWVLVIRLTSLVEDLKQGQEAYLRDLDANLGALRANYQSQGAAIQLQQYQSARCR